MKFYIIAGEASGDLHASNLVREMKALDPSTDFRGWGGDLMQHEGVELVKHFSEVAFMGFAEVVRNLNKILGALKKCKQDILEYQPDALILVDYPGFNLRIAEFAHKNHIRVIYYISPQVWAWKKSRVHKIRRTVDKMLVILPFEKEFYARYNFPVSFCGHPLLDVTSRPSTYQTKQEFLAEYHLDERPIVALLPGSRKQEISRMLPMMAGMSSRFPDHQFIVAAAPSQEKEYYQDLLSGIDLPVIAGETHEILRHAMAALVTSGTATLETALFEVPEVVCYKGNMISYLIARQLVNVKYISLVNLIMNREVVKELIQEEFNRTNLEKELARILDPSISELIKEDYRQLIEKLGSEGASKRAASEILGFMQ